MKIGAQFFTLRDKCTNLDDFSETLKRVADIGYTEVQISGVCKYEPEWLRDELKKSGLSCVITHFCADEIKNDPVGVVKNHNIFGCKNIGLGSMPGGIVTEESLGKFISDYKPVAKIIKENGSKLFYHNHHWEFSRLKTGEMLIEKLVKSFDEDELNITLDTYWAQYGGCNVCDIISKLKGRLECVHLKDMVIVGDEQRMAPVGYGNMNFERIVKALDDAGSKHLLVEQDNSYGEDSFECLRKSYEYLKSLGLK